MNPACDLSPRTPPAFDRPPTLPEVHQKYADYVQALLKPRVPSRDLPDLVQQSFIEIDRGLPRYDAARPIQPWIATIVFRTVQRYLVRSVLRLRAETSFSMDPHDFEPGSEDRVAARDLLPRLLACLKERQREMVIRHLRDEETVEAISRDMGITKDNGFKVLQTALAKLQDAARRHEATERRQLGGRRALLLPFGLGLRVEGWITRKLAWAKAALGSGGLTIALGAVMLPPFSASAPTSQVAPPIAVAVDTASAVKASAIVAIEEANRASAPVRTVEPLPSSSAKRAAGPSSSALRDSQDDAERASLERIEKLLESNPSAARAALAVHKKTFRDEGHAVDRHNLEERVNLATAHQQQKPPRPRMP